MNCIIFVYSFINIPHFKCDHRISRLENELQEAKKKILDLEPKNKQNDNDVEMLKRENRSVSMFCVFGIDNELVCE